MGKVAKNNPSKTNKKTKDVQKQGNYNHFQTFDT